MTRKEIADQFNVSIGSIASFFASRHIAAPKSHERNSHYFDSLDTPEKIYWVGYLYMTGTFTKGRDGYTIKLSSARKEGLEKFRQAIQGEAIPIAPETKQGPNSHQWQFRFRDRHMYESLERYGCTSEFKYDIIPPLWSHHFFRGVYDACGRLTCFTTKRGIYICRMFITTPNQSVLYQIARYSQIHCKIAQTTENGINYQLTISGWKKVCRMLQFLYQNSAEHMRMGWQYQRGLDCLNKARRH